MNRLILAAALAAGCTLVSSAPALGAARNYDCSKAGNANKAACKTAAKAAAKAAPAKAGAPRAAATKVSSTTTTKTVTQRNYDCSKAGNRNRAVCKSAAASPAKPVAKQTTVATATRHYDCTKPGNAGKEQCKVSTASNQTVSKPVAAPRPAAKPAVATAQPKPSVRKAAAPASVENSNPAGAIAQCKDGTYSHAKVRTGACSRHGGVAKWS